MLKHKITFLKKNRISRFMCALFLCLCLVGLSGCEDTAPNSHSQGELAVAAEKETLKCWSCSLFELGFTVAKSLEVDVLKSVSKSALSLLAVGYGLWQTDGFQRQKNRFFQRCFDYDDQCRSRRYVKACRRFRARRARRRR